MEIITVITHAMDISRKNLSINEQKMLIDIYKGVNLTPHLIGNALIVWVEDSFNLYPNYYEEKWGVKKEEMIEKIKALDSVSRALVELWASGFWAMSTNQPGELDDYIKGKLNLANILNGIIKQLENISKSLLQTRSAFKSATVAESRVKIDRIVHNLQQLLF